jgi:glycosyltransferase involved in cell wall biosynthesis
VDVALVAPCPVPYSPGGAEVLLRGLRDALERSGEHRVEVFKLPTPEVTAWDVVAGYERFAALDLRAFDLVVSGKYPAWMVDHPRHVVYMLHRLRGLYDTYPSGLPHRYPDAPRLVAEVRELLAANAGRRAALGEVFERLRHLRDHPRAPADLWAYPGPWIREVVHWLDGVALAPAAIHRYGAIAHEVAGRPDYFPPDELVFVAHPPTALPVVPGVPAPDVVFTASRLDGPKRIDLLVRALAHVRRPVRLRIAGAGPEEGRLRVLAAEDPRVELLGRISDAQLVEEYRRATVVGFVPRREDYGYITLEAFLAGRPVVTCTDSGGSTEFVVDGVTGRVTPPEPAALGAAIDGLLADPAGLDRMGAAARQRASRVTWPTVVAELTAEVPARPRPLRRIPRAGGRPKLVVASSFAVWPPRGGGQQRLAGLYSAIAASGVDVVVVCAARGGTRPREREQAPGVTEVLVPRTAELLRLQDALHVEAGIPADDLALALGHERTPAYAAALRRHGRDARAIVCAHPYGLPAVEAAGLDDHPLLYEAVDVEAEQKGRLLGETAPRLARAVEQLEQSAVRRAEVVLCCSDRDAGELGRRYGAHELLVVPNGADPAAVAHATVAERRARAQRLGVAPAALFLGSWHPPNVEAALDILAAARLEPDLRFAVVGSVGGALVDEDVPRNADVTGAVEDGYVEAVRAVAGVALNPMRSGSGTNLKMLEYALAGLPIVSTAFGARGLGLRPGDHFVEAGGDELGAAVRAVLEAPVEQLQARADAARAIVLDGLTWERIAARFLGDDRVGALLGLDRAEAAA